jgi:hypothetical protein
MTATSIRGSCLCGAVSFEISPPFLFFHYCHCSRCRKSHGAPFASNLLVRGEQFRWLQGEDVARRWELPNAARFCTGFCGVCGSPVPWVTRDGKAFLVPAGSLDDDPVERPERNIFWASRAPWEVEVADLPTFDEGHR